MKEKVGIAIINFNSTEYLKVTIQCLLKARVKTEYSVCVIENGSKEKEVQSCKVYIDELIEEGNLNISFIDAKKNLGFSGGNNLAIKYFLEKDDITHICLLNSDVIVSDGWLDYLLEKDKDVIGPVTNAAGNEQTIAIDYEIDLKDNIDKMIEEVNRFAELRHFNYEGYVVESDLVTFFATIFKRKVIEKVGLLDERFYPGSYEDDDYCMRILQSDFQIWIARDCFLHHWGSGSFSKLNMKNRRNIGNENKKRFEEKWKTKWNDRTWKLLKSCRQDVSYLLKKEHLEWSRNQLDNSLTQVETLIEDWGGAIEFFTSRDENIQAAQINYSAEQLLNMLIAKIKNKIKREFKRSCKKIRSSSSNVKSTNKKDIANIMRLIENAHANKIASICVFAPMYNKENEKDGYVQRIKAIDTSVLSDMCRIYLYDEGIECNSMRIDIIDNQHGYIVFNSHNDEHRNVVFKLVTICGRTYTHSILRFIEDRTDKRLWELFDLPGVKHFWDVHGVVPEEYELSGSELGAKLANNIETFIINKVEVIVVVTNSMGNYLQRKYPDVKAKIIVVPILNPKLLVPEKSEKKALKERPSVVYAGGTQPWQNIELMQDIMEKTMDKFDYKMFVPDVTEFMRIWGKRKRNSNMSVESKSPDDLYEEYRKCDFGFVLRDDSPVNYVACPTKIIEYLKFGIIPVLKSLEIGDFIELGMKYIPYQTFLKGINMSEAERNTILENNKGVLLKLQHIYECGIAELKKSVEVL